MASVQSEQVEQLKAIFDRFNMDPDDSLTQLELAALLCSLGVQPSGAQPHALLSAINVNANGFVEFKELLSAILPDLTTREALITQKQDQLLQIFRSFDRDGNGYITLAELTGSMAKMAHPLTYHELSEMMQEANADSLISFGEFAAIGASTAGCGCTDGVAGSGPAGTLCCRSNRFVAIRVLGDRAITSTLGFEIF